jgi:formylglycine-generating enzyme required for sulfatase activity
MSRSLLLPGLGAALAGALLGGSGNGAPLPGGPREVTNSVGMRLRLIPAGRFLMGSPQTEAGRREDEGPRHEVTLTRPFYLGVYPVTQEEYRHLTGKNPSFCSPEGVGKKWVRGLDTARFPVEQVTWTEAVAFCAKLSALPEEKAAGRVYRLPTEAEWEYACRAGTDTPFWWGDSASSLQDNFDGREPYGGAARGPFLQRTCRVGSYLANPWGLHDLHGNVFQWCADWYDPRYYALGMDRDPKGPQNGTVRVLRGGAWSFGGKICRAAGREAAGPDDVYDQFGFRVAMSFVPGQP